MAHKAGINERAFSSCLESGRYDAAIQTDIAEGKRARVEGTPAFLVNGKLYSGALSFEKFQSIIDADLASASGN